MPLSIDTWTFECSVMGGVGTVWKGSAVECQCSEKEIFLIHSRYNSSDGTNSSVFCNNGGVTIVGQIVEVSENTYTSQIIVSDNARKSSLIGKSVECKHDNGIAIEVVRKYIINNFINDSSNTSKYNCFL